MPKRLTQEEKLQRLINDRSNIIHDLWKVHERAKRHNLPQEDCQIIESAMIILKSRQSRDKKA